MYVITISRQYGSGGDEIAEQICKKTGYKMFDKHLLAQAASEAGLNEEMINNPEQSRRLNNFFDRLFVRSQPAIQASVWVQDTNGPRMKAEVQLAEKESPLLVQRAVETAYDMGQMVIVGRGGQMILKDCPGVLHIRVEAPMEERILRVRKGPELVGRSFSDSVEIRRAAQDIIEAQDAASADYLKRVFGVRWDDPSLYHLVINTGKVKVEQAARMIIEAARILDMTLETG